MRKKKKNLTKTDFDKIIVDNNRENPFDISNYTLKSIIDNRLNWKSHAHFYVKIKCKLCGKNEIKDMQRFSLANINFLSYCRRCNLIKNSQQKYGTNSAAQTIEVIEKRIKTNLNKYGKEYPSQTKSVQDKRKSTCIERYGVDNISKMESVKKKKEDSCIKNFGETCNLKVISIIDKIKETKLNKYGSLCITHKYNYDNQFFDSSWELIFYIYHKDKGHLIKHEPKYFEYLYKRKLHLYFPDFKVNNQYYEIKGDQFFEYYKNGKIKKMINPYDSSQNGLYNAKYKCMIEHNINIINNDKIIKYVDYFKRNYPLDYLDKFKMKGDEIDK